MEPLRGSDGVVMSILLVLMEPLRGSNGMFILQASIDGTPPVFGFIQ